LCGGEAGDECAADGIELEKLSGDLRRLVDIWARSAVAG
jgi:hypothetical protein